MAANDIEAVLPILAAMVEGVMLVNAQGRIVLANPAARAMFHWPWAVEGRHYIEVVRQPDISAQFAAALSGTPRPPAEVELERDRRRIYTARAMPMPAERGGGAVLVLHDITDLKHADQVRRDFVANVSHELRTPLTAIRGYIEALSDDEGPAPADARKFLDIIARHTTRMERLVRDLLRLARLDAGQESLALERLPLESVVAGVETEMQALLVRKRQHLIRDFSSNAMTIQADPAKIHDVLRNLVENACNYGPEGSDIAITARATETMLSLTVADRGPGIPDDDLPRIFERFYRADRSRTTDPGGTGLGLAIVRHLIELHGGHASARHREGGGAEVMVTLPNGGGTPPTTD
jgi:two-component system phosphate regulon sensor histidine kinase PhoR